MQILKGDRAMTMTDAKRSLKKIIESNYGEMLVPRGTMQDAVEALEKQIPKKPDKANITMQVLNSETEDWKSVQEDCYECPVCRGFLGYVADCEDEDLRCNYCTICGQAIDWEGYDEDD